MTSLGGVEISARDWVEIKTQRSALALDCHDDDVVDDEILMSLGY